MNSLHTKKIKLWSSSIVLMFCSSLLYTNCSQRGFQVPDTTGGSNLASSEPSAVAVVFSKAPSDNVNTNSVSFSYDISGQNLSSVSTKCYLNQTLQANCSSPIDLTSVPDGDYTLTIDAINQNSLVLAEAQKGFRLDRKAPVLTINQAPSGSIGATSASIIFSVSDNFPNPVAYCSLDSAAFASCRSPYNMTNLSLSSHSVQLYAQDAAGNKSSTQTVSFSVSLSAPTVAISQMPLAFTNATSASFSFSGISSSNTIASYRCSMDNNVFTACSSPQSYSSLVEGSHSFSVKAIDALGQASSPASYSFSVDLTKPSAPVVSSNLMNPTKSTSLNLTFNSTDSSGIAKYECKLDAGSYATCVSPQAFASLSSANHTFTVRATDKAGNVSAEGSYSILIDTVAPVVTMTSQPASSTQQTSASFSFTVSDALSGVNLIECQLDSQAYANCSSPQAYSNLAAGNHTFNLRCTDKAGNSSIKPYSWSIVAASTPTPTPIPPPAITHIFILMFENTNAQDSISQPFMGSLIPQGSYLNNYHGIGHPSQPNYIALVAGDTLGVTDDSDYNLNYTHLGDLLEAKGLNWKIYVEDYPGNCFTGSSYNTYVRKHNPFISFNNVHNNSSRCNKHIVPAGQLDTDIANNQVPAFAMYVPGLNNDGHDTGVAYADNWFQQTFQSKLQDSNFMKGMAFVVTFDENDASNDISNNLIYTLIYGPHAGIRAGVTSNDYYDHYSLLRWVEDTFNLGTLNRNDALASPIVGIAQ